MVISTFFFDLAGKRKLLVNDYVYCSGHTDAEQVERGLIHASEQKNSEYYHKDADNHSAN
jgi:hypothetical protein